MPAPDWLSVIRTEYLRDFIKSGGAAVKFVVPAEEAEHQSLQGGLGEAARDEGYAWVSLDAAATRVHLIDKLFNDLARQIDWDGLAFRFLQDTLKECYYLTPETREEFSLSALASLNGLDIGSMRAVINSRLQDRLYRDYSMTHEFRLAMFKLCQAQLDPEDLNVGMAEAVQEWLRGELQLLAPLKSASIFQKIGRHNARDMVSSLSYWLHLTGYSGLALSLDISRILQDKRPKKADGSVYYSPAAVLDAYEVLRQFVDSTDELQYCLVVVFAPPRFLTDEQRGLRRYDALYLRVWDEVRDPKRPNPLSSLVRCARSEDDPALEAVGGSR